MANESAFWFKHDSNAKDDPKVSLLIDQLGLEGYGAFWMLLETLREQPGYIYPVKLLPTLARKYMITTEKLKTVVYNYALFTVKEDNIFYSEGLIKRMDKYNEIKELRRDAGRKGGLAKGTASKSLANAKQVLSKSIADAKQTDSISLASRVEYSRVEGTSVTTSTDKPKGLLGNVPLLFDENTNDEKKLYEELLKSLEGKSRDETWIAIKNFVAEKKPTLSRPYADLWNLFATTYGLAKVEIVNSTRAKKLKSRLGEKTFDFIRILEGIRKSKMLKGESADWRVSFDWIIENQSNYQKIIEGNYGK